MNLKKLNDFLAAICKRPFIAGLLIRIAIMIILPILLDDGIFLQGVKYTDIDYEVFTDAARHIANGKSPYKRHTYRYTPFLAWVLSFGSNPNVESGNSFFWFMRERYYGRLLFCIADAFCGLIIMKMRKEAREENEENKEKKDEDSQSVRISEEVKDALWWMLNPLPINICTRGSAESFVVLLSVLGTVAVATSKTFKKPIWVKAMIAGVIHGLAIHAKLYPIIYTASFMTYFAYQEKRSRVVYGWQSQIFPARLSGANDSIRYPFPWTEPKRLFQLITLWIGRLFCKSSLMFLFTSMSTFGLLTYLAVHFYGQIALEEGLLYHFSRLDHRHNYSFFWYLIYLAKSRMATVGGDSLLLSLKIMGRILLVPQLVLLVFSSLGIAPYDLTFALFIQTFLFVALNKVITAQYFLWYFALLPLCADRIEWRSKEMFAAIRLLVTSILTWLGSAFLLEMKGMSVHFQVWLASILYFAANVNFLKDIMANYKRPKEKMT